MKKIVVMGVLLGLLSVFSGSAQAATGGRFFFGAFAEMGQYLSYQGIGFGGEVGYAVSNLIRVVAEGAVGHMSLEYRSESQYLQYHNTMDMKVAPFCLSLHFTAPLGDRVHPYVGIGLAYSSVKLTSTSTSEYRNYGESEKSTRSESYNLEALAPVFKMGVAISLADHFRIVGEYSQNFAKDRMVEDRVPGFSEQEVFFGSSNIRFGIRIVL